MKLGIRKVKTFKGVKYGVVNLETKDLHIKGEEKPKFLAKDYDVVETKTMVALFDLTSQGLENAHKLKNALSK